jgi:Asp-tRNA(Asn)/Glu-tRNA(Gln) amidotransferase A subunit family amidase
MGRIGEWLMASTANTSNAVSDSTVQGVSVQARDVQSVSVGDSSRDAVEERWRQRYATYSAFVDTGDELIISLRDIWYQIHEREEVRSQLEQAHKLLRDLHSRLTRVALLDQDVEPGLRVCRAVASSLYHLSRADWKKNSDDDREYSGKAVVSVDDAVREFERFCRYVATVLG